MRLRLRRAKPLSALQNTAEAGSCGTLSWCPTVSLSELEFRGTKDIQPFNMWDRGI